MLVEKTTGQLKLELWSFLFFFAKSGFISCEKQNNVSISVDFTVLCKNVYFPAHKKGQGSSMTKLRARQQHHQHLKKVPESGTRQVFGRGRLVGYPRESIRTHQQGETTKM